MAEGRRGWAAVRLVHAWRRRMRASWAPVPADVRRRWWKRLAVGYAGVLALTAALTWAAARLEGPALRAAELRWLRALEASPVTFHAAVWMETPGNDIALWPLVLLAGGMAGWRGRPFRAVGMLVGFFVLYLPILAAWTAWPRDRPTIIAQGIASPGGMFSSFPSGHVVHTVFAYGLLALWWSSATDARGERVVAFLFAAAATATVALGRLRLGAHWPSDVLAALVIGGAWLAVVAHAVRRAEAEAGGRA
jgi:membrane-associated phospholipid phosphatase